uniref:Protein S-acyltransferase n=1 Tax=Panagrellus redivivus TaxID=6233 RepID=A0A7E4VQN6_PANRE
MTSLASASDGIELPMLAPHNGKGTSVPRTSIAGASSDANANTSTVLLEPNGVGDNNGKPPTDTDMDRKASVMLSKKRMRSFESEDSIVFHRDPFNKPEHVITLRGRELVFFVMGYIVAVVCILGVFELVMPVIFTNDPQRNAKRA